jgi:membrane-associated protein
MDFFVQLFHTLYPLTQKKLNDFIHSVGPGSFYVAIFLIIFCETGLVVTPFLPGDSLLFTLGAIGSGESAAFGLVPMAVMCVIAAVLGDAVNYGIGYRIGPKVFSREDSRLLNKKHLQEAQRFYEKYGGKTIILARFVPVVRTFAPFVAGVGRMSYPRFFLYNVVGAVAWVGLCIGAGALFGSREWVQKNFEVVIIAIVIISVLPIGVEILRARIKSRNAAKAENAGTPS